MAKITVELPDDVVEIIKQRAEDLKTTPEAYVATNLVLLFRPCIFDRSKWLKPGKDNSVTYDPYKV